MSMRDRRRRGFSAVEVMVAVIITALVLVPLLTLLFQERTTTVRGHLYFLAYLAAREEVGDIRFRLAAGEKPEALTHGLTPLKGATFERLKAVTVGGDPGLKYEEPQERIETKVDWEPDAGGMKIGTLSVKYAKGDEGALKISFSARRPGPVSCP